MNVLIGYKETTLSEGIGCLLEAKNIAVIEETDDLDDLRRMVRERSPDVVVLGTTFGGPAWMDVVEELAGGEPAVPVLLVTPDPATDPIGRGIEAGARGAVSAAVTGDELIRAVMALARGERHLCTECAQVVADLQLTSGEPLVDQLSDREREVLSLLADGHGAKEIGFRLGISSKTVDTHRQNISRKLGVESLADLVKVALQARLTSPRPS